jgi:GNAT superfamily N-acetyltransferase
MGACAGPRKTHHPYRFPDIKRENRGRRSRTSRSIVARIPAKWHGSDNKCMRPRVDKGQWRRGRAADAAAIRELTRAAYAKWVPIIGREPKPMTADYALALQKHRFDLLCVEGKPVAVIETLVESDHLLIENVAVSPPFQGQGLGSRLMAQAEQIARAAGLTEIKLYTNKFFVENLRLYSRLGYHVDREEAFTGGIVVHMSKQVQAPHTEF